MCILHTPFPIPKPLRTKVQYYSGVSLSGQLPKLEGCPLKVPHNIMVLKNELLFLRDAHCYRIIYQTKIFIITSYLFVHAHYCVQVSHAGFCDGYM